LSPISILATVVYVTFLGFLIIAVGSSVSVLLTAVLARLLGDKRYSDCLRVFSKASALLFATACALLVLAIELADHLSPTPSMLLSFLVSVWEVPLTITAVLLIISASLMFLYYRTQSGLRAQSHASAFRPSLLAGLVAFTGCLSLLFYNLLNSFMLTPSVPSGLAAVVQAQSLAPLTQLGLMVNSSWIPLSLKLLLVGCVAFTILFSGAAALRRMKSGGSGEENAWLDFMTSWGFKTATVFGASLGIIGYWCAAAFHSSEPSVAMFLMGVPMKGVSAAFSAAVGAMWDVGTAGAMSLGALAGVYYLSRGKGLILPRSSEQRVLRMFLPLLFILLAIGTYGVLVSGETYPQQFVLAIGVFLGGYLLLEAVRRYSLGQARLYVPALIFTVLCYGLLLYQAPNTEWYNAAALGGVSWPLLGFPLLAVTVYYFATRWRELKYWIPIAVTVMVLLIIVVKVADVALVRGSTIVTLDSRYTGIVASWALKTGNDLTFLSQQYPIPTNLELLVGLLLSLLAFLGVLYWFVKAVSPRRPSTFDSTGIAAEVRQ
jgi:hypothetical protein